MFRDEAERLRAREAAYAFHKERCRAIHVEVYDDTFDRLYPPVVEPAAQEEDVYAMMARVGADAFNSIGRAPDATPSPAPDISDEEKVLALNAAGWFKHSSAFPVEAPAPEEEDAVRQSGVAGSIPVDGTGVQSREGGKFLAGATPASLHSPSPAFAAAVDALEDAVRHHLFNAESTARRHAARAALVRCHLEEVRNARHND